MTSGPASSPAAVSAEVSSTYEMTAAPRPSVVTCRKSPRLRSPPVTQPSPLVQICPCLIGCSLTVACWYVGLAACALRLWPSCTDHSAFVRLAAPNEPPWLVEDVWYHATS